jgi:hypothetical protein
MDAAFDVLHVNALTNTGQTEPPPQIGISEDAVQIALFVRKLTRIQERRPHAPTPDELLCLSFFDVKNQERLKTSVRPEGQLALKL